MKQFSFYAILLSGFVQIISGTLTFDRTSIETNTKACKIVVCIKKNVNNNVNSFNLDGHLMRDFDGEIFFTMEISRKAPDRDAYKTIVHTPKLNYCQIGKKDMKVSVNHLVIEKINMFGSIPMACPARQGHYYLDNVVLPDGAIPTALLTTGHYKYVLKFTDEAAADPLIFALTIYFSFNASTAGFPVLGAIDNPLDIKLG